MYLQNDRLLLCYENRTATTTCIMQLWDIKTRKLKYERELMLNQSDIDDSHRAAFEIVRTS